MNQRFLLSLIAACLLTTWMVPEASALSRRLPRSVENFHTCEEFIPGTSIRDPCFGATSVTDTLYGWDGEKAICTMTGRVFCIPVLNGEICSTSDSSAPIVSADSWTAGATFDVVESAENLTFLNPSDGQDVCDATYFDTEPPMETVFNKFWPNELVAHSVYTGEFTNLEDSPTTYELIEHCTINVSKEQYDCYPLWDSSTFFAEDLRPKLPCCGVSNKLTVEIAGVGGTVTSDDGKIYCPETCDAVYDGTSAPYDGCPEVVLKATPWEVDGSDYAFTGWDGCDSAVGDTCTTSAKGNPTVTATFEVSYHTLTVEVFGGGDKGRAWIFQPRSDFDEPEQFYCYDACTKKFGDGGQFPMGELVTIKRKGATFENWGGACQGVPNSADTCTVEMDTSRTVEVHFAE